MSHPNTEVLRLDWAKGNGLLPAIVQHWLSGEVLMLGYMNAEALAQTQASVINCEIPVPTPVVRAAISPRTDRWCRLVRPAPSHRRRWRSRART